MSLVNFSFLFSVVVPFLFLFHAPSILAPDPSVAKTRVQLDLAYIKLDLDLDRDTRFPTRNGRHTDAHEKSPFESLRGHRRSSPGPRARQLPKACIPCWNAA